MKVNAGTYIRAHVFRSSEAAVSLATKNPAKHLSFAKALIAAKNAQVSSARINAVTKFIINELKGPELLKYVDIRQRTRLSRTVLSKSESLIVERFKNQPACELKIHWLTNKQARYINLEWKLVSLAETSSILSKVTAPSS